jgi:hypothetical protein
MYIWFRNISEWFLLIHHQVRYRTGCGWKDLARRDSIYWFTLFDTITRTSCAVTTVLSTTNRFSKMVFVLSESISHMIKHPCTTTRSRNIYAIISEQSCSASIYVNGTAFNIWYIWYIYAHTIRLRSWNIILSQCFIWITSITSHHIISYYIPS